MESRTFLSWSKLYRNRSSGGKGHFSLIASGTWESGLMVNGTGFAKWLQMRSSIDIPLLR